MGAKMITGTACGAQRQNISTFIPINQIRNLLLGHINGQRKLRALMKTFTASRARIYIKYLRIPICVSNFHGTPSCVLQKTFLGEIP